MCASPPRLARRAMSDDSDGQRQCRRSGGVVDVHELNAAMALADMAGVGTAPQVTPTAAEREDEEEELASTRLSLELGRVGIQSSPCSSSSSGHPPHPAQQSQADPAASTAAPGYGPRHMLTEAEKEAKRLRRVLANRESARQTILRRQAIRDELARKVADLSSQNENMKKEKDMAMQEYLALKEANKQLKEQVAGTTNKAPAATPVTTAMHAAPPTLQAEGMTASTATPPQPRLLYTAAPPPAVPVPYVWGSWPPPPGYEHGSQPGPPPGLCLPPCAWYYPVVADRLGSPSYPQQQQPLQDPRAAAGPASPAGGGATAEDDTDDDPCSLTLAIDVDKRSAPVSTEAGGSRAVGQHQGPASDRDKAATAAKARKRRKELTKLKHVHSASRAPAGE
ncbi:actin cytoskeleton-regulatory complex protein pan-1-like [Phragmites australis]|uniref:actin cytoskeleton-regulatory complex protein pan-1-like n=1 Tax=Phragmites australis TaxID=29695 RepID=UPI002D7A30BC|nr:actin cytoskeleton-regulatory complex protein pan-1-like [Phragmites australis]